MVDFIEKFSMKAFAIWKDCSSVPSPLSAFMACKMKRQLDFTYPSEAEIRSIVGENMRGTAFGLASKNSIPVTSHLPVQRAVAQASSKSKGKFFAFARAFAPASISRQGALTCVS